MIARLWWKEARQVWPIWAFLAGLGLLWMNLLRWYVNTGPGPRIALVGQAILITFVYLFLIGAAVFAGERENRTLGLLDALPVERWRVWVAKASFAATTTAALGVLLSLFAVALEGPPPAGGRDLVGFFLLCGVGWSLFWSALSGNALLAAALGMASLGLTFIQLNWGTPYMLEAPRSDTLTVWHWVIAVALIPASAAILQLGGPPQSPPSGPRRRSRVPLVERPEIERAEPIAGRRRFAAVWLSSLSSLVWQALRETWPVWWPVAVMGVGLPVAWAVGLSPNEATPWLLSLLLVSLILGVNVFNAENRGGTQRFLAHHGARPGVVWLVKLAVGLATAAPIWFTVLLLAMYTLASGRSALTPTVWPSLAHFAFYAQGAIVIVSLFTGGFAAGAWCGMVFRRGITAGMVSLVLWLVICLPASFLAFGGLVWPTHLIWIPIGILAVTWAWSGDWLLDRPGFGRWARLGLYSATAAGVLFSAHVAERVWTVPTLDPADRERIFQFARIGAPVPPEENAADLYREVGLNNLGYPPIGIENQDFHDIIHENWDPNNPEILAWLSRNEANLEMLRRAAAMPACRFRDLRKLTLFSMNESEPGMNGFAPALTVSGRVRLARGDLKGAWTDIEALLRMGRQFSGLNPFHVRWWGIYAESWGLSLAMRWAADPRQTAESLEEARALFRALPPLPSLADQLRADALVVHNTSELPREEIVLGGLSNHAVRSSATKLALDAMTTPWELVRARRVYDLLAAVRIQLAEREPERFIAFPRPEDILGAPAIGEGSSATTARAKKLVRLARTTPLAMEGTRRFGMIVSLSSDDNNVPRRAFDVILGLRLWQVQHGGRLPRSLDELEAADPEIRESLIDPHAKPPAQFGYVPSRGQTLPRLGLFTPLRGDQSTQVRLEPTDGHMLLYSVGPDGNDDRAAFSLNSQKQGDIVFPIQDDVPPPG